MSVADQRQVGDPHGERVGGVHPVRDGEVVEHVQQRAALRLQARRHLGEQQGGADAVLVRTDAGSTQ